MTKPPSVSVVVPAMNEAKCLPKLHQELTAACDPLGYQFEFIFVDDGSTDDSLEILSGLRRRDDRVRYLALSRNFGHQAALSAGLAHASGDAVIMMDGDLQHPPALIPELLEQWRAGHDVVNTIRLETAEISPLKKVWSRLFYATFNLLANVRVEPGGADFRLMSRSAVAALNDLPERQRFLRGLVPWLGFRQARVEFRAPARWAGRSKYTFRRNIRFALEGITAFSFYPLRLVTIFGGMIAMASLLGGVVAAGFHILAGAAVPGLTSLLLCMLFLGGCQLAVLGIIGEYVGRTLEQVKGRPMYILREAVGFLPAAAAAARTVPSPHLPRLRPQAGEAGERTGARDTASIGTAGA
jgi:polyisoprenyl-phosphate glycosyltransferase